MFEHMTEQEARAEILKAVEAYCKKYHLEKSPYKPGDRIPYASRVYDEREMSNLVDSSLDFWLTAGRYTKAFEKAFSRYLGVRFVSLVNSGSSANLLAFMTLTSPLLGERRVKRGDEVITVAAGFPTTVSPILQFGAVPVFVDVTTPTYNIDVALLEGALSEKTKAVMIAHTLGNPFDLKAVKGFCEKHGLWLVEDNCDALGARFTINGEERMTGTWGDLGTSSFYPAHHMTTGEGGAVYTNDPLLHRAARSIRDWGRDCICPPGQDDTCHHRFDGQYGELPKGYDHKYVYSHFGYNLKATDMQAAVGLAQLEKLPDFVERRRENFDFFFRKVADLSDVLELPEETEGGRASWFGFPVTLKGSLDRTKVVTALEKKGVQTRMLFSGNLLRHPCFDDLRGTDAYRVASSLENTDRIMEKTFWLGMYPGMTEEKLTYMAEALHEAVR